MNHSSFKQQAQKTDKNSLQYLSQHWAKKYIKLLDEPDDCLDFFLDQETPNKVASNLMQELRPKSLHAWAKTEILLAKEIVRHQINPKLIDPWDIAGDSYQVYEKALSAYADQISSSRFSTLIAADMGEIRQKYTETDPRVIGFTSMQFHYTGLELLSTLPPQQQATLGQYFKVIDDHLYMPLQRAYDGAASYPFNAPELQVVQRSLPRSTDIARRIVARVVKLHPNHRCHHGALDKPEIQISSIRDVEMFQVYLWVCILENSVQSIQQELFPLCVMLYPRLNVSWEMVRQLIRLLGVELKAVLEPEQLKYFAPYYQVLWNIFSPEVFPNCGA